MSELFTYLTRPEILCAVVGPWAITLTWYIREVSNAQLDKTLAAHWLLCVIGSYVLSGWHVTPDVRELHIINVFFIYEALYLYLGRTMSAGTAFSLTFLCDWSVDMLRASELIAINEATKYDFYFGVGGAGAGDGLYLYAMAAALLVPYVHLRRHTLPSSAKLDRGSNAQLVN